MSKLLPFTSPQPCSLLTLPPRGLGWGGWQMLWGGRDPRACGCGPWGARVLLAEDRRPLPGLL